MGERGSRGRHQRARPVCQGQCVALRRSCVILAAGAACSYNHAHEQDEAGAILYELVLEIWPKVSSQHIGGAVSASAGATHARARNPVCAPRDLAHTCVRSSPKRGASIAAAAGDAIPSAN